ncbi:MAG: hypothetical protein LBB18_00495 [Puniceicoccales bacterium]|jgi:hypothetical protein|nr:hypothetical protein [Puniceicoccales bacterium]
MQIENQSARGDVNVSGNVFVRGWDYVVSHIKKFFGIEPDSKVSNNVVADRGVGRPQGEGKGELGIEDSADENGDDPISQPSVYEYGERLQGEYIGSEDFADKGGEIVNFESIGNERDEVKGENIIALEFESGKKVDTAVKDAEDGGSAFSDEWDGPEVEQDSDSGQGAEELIGDTYEETPVSADESADDPGETEPL